MDFLTLLRLAGAAGLAVALVGATGLTAVVAAPVLAALLHAAALAPAIRPRVERVWPALTWVVDLIAISTAVLALGPSVGGYSTATAAHGLIVLIVVVSATAVAPVVALPLGLASAGLWLIVPDLAMGRGWGLPAEPVAGVMVALVAVVASLAGQRQRDDGEGRGRARSDLATALDDLAGLFGATPDGERAVRLVARLTGARGVALLLYGTSDGGGNASGSLGESARLHTYLDGTHGAATVHAPRAQRADASGLGCRLPAALSWPGGAQRVVLIGSETQPFGKLLVVEGSSPRPLGATSDPLAAVAQVLSAASERRALREQVQAGFLATIESLIVGLEAKDPYTQGHSLRVTEYALETARELGLDEAALAEIRIGGMLHDIGKIGIPEAILHKPGRLTPEEMTVVEEHPRVGARIIDSFNTSADVLAFVLHHHERLDGRGYPSGLAGMQIPLVARIAKVADSFDAMTSRRPYGTPKTFGEAAAILRTDSGTHFDPPIVDAFIRVLEREGFDLRVAPRPANGTSTMPAPPNGATPPFVSPPAPPDAPTPTRRRSLLARHDAVKLSGD